MSSLAQPRNRKPLTVADKARLLLKWSWLDESAPQRRELANAEACSYPAWLESEFELARSYRSARARLWVPEVEEVKGAEGGIEAWLEGQLTKNEAQLDPLVALDREAQIDILLRDVWRGMTQEQRAAGMLRAKFECMRRVGWRMGYSAGYPGSTQSGENTVNDAWQAWLAMNPATRAAEERAAWKLRDRSRVYVDDSAVILGSPAPRWFASPERAGPLSFLPNIIVRLVRNHTPKGTSYDPFKATFRVPLNMHKHELRSYLLHIYGLRTTWVRSMVYRSPVAINTRTRQKKTGSGRTYKKVEVGLLEPFFFPEVDSNMINNRMMQPELDFERARVYLKMTRAARWRGRKDFAVGPTSSVDGAAATPARPLARTTGIPAARHGRILATLARKREEREQAVQAYILEQRTARAAAEKQQQQA